MKTSLNAMKADQFFQTQHSRIRARWLAPNAVRISHAPRTPQAESGSDGFPPDRPWLEHVLLPQQSSFDGEPELGVEAQDGCVRVDIPEGGELFREARPARLGIQQRKPYLSLDIPKAELRLGLRRVDGGVRLAIAFYPDEAFYGWGEWFNAFRRTSGKLHLRTRDAIAMLQNQATYSAIPVFLSCRGYALWLLNSHASRWQIDPRRGILQVDADGPGADYILIYGPAFKRILSTYTALAGRPPLLPRWAFGLWSTSYPQGNQESVLEHARQHQQRGIPLDAVILDYHWEERFHNFRWRSSLIPDPQGLIDGFQGMGVRLGLIQTPFLNIKNRPFQKFLLNTLAHNLPPGLERDDERALAEYEEAREKGYLAHENAKWWFGAGGMPDFSNPQTAVWWNDSMRPFYQQGVAFFKNDANQSYSFHPQQG